MINKLPSSVEREERAGRVTAGLSALSALHRAIQERKGYTRQVQRDIAKDVERREKVFVAPDGTRARNVKEAGLGRPLTGYEVQKRLEKLNPSLIFKPSRVPGRICVYYPIHDDVLGDIDHYVCAMERGLMPEFSVLNFIEEDYFDAQTLATPEGTGTIKKRTKINETNPETRGWRTVLIKLIKSGLITESGAAKAFGLPTHDSKNWQAQFNVTV